MKSSDETPMIVLSQRYACFAPLVIEPSARQSGCSKEQMTEHYKLLYSMILLAPGKHLPKSQLRAIIRIADEDGSLSGRFSKSRVKSAAQREFIRR